MTGSAEAYVVVMPRLGLSMTEGTIVAWHKQEGETVAKGELLFSFESDKSTLEIEAPADGLLHILIPAGETVAVQTPVAQIGEGGQAALPAAQPANASARLGPVSSDAYQPGDRRQLAASPRARAQARSLGLSLEGLKASGPRDMIVVADLAQAPPKAPVRATPLARRRAAAAGIDLAALGGSNPPQRITRADVERALSLAPPAPTDAGHLQGLFGLRAIIAERLSTGWRERPQVTLTTDADAARLVALREDLSGSAGEKILYDALFVLIVARALREFPTMNATLTRQGIQQLSSVHVGVAIQTERGLLVPVLRDADRLSLPAIQRGLKELAARALGGRSLPDDLSGGTFTITNLGMFGIDAFTPIINPPEAAILGIGRIVPRPVGLDGAIVLRPMVALSLSFDHRLNDGAPAARFLARVRELVEAPPPLDPQAGSPDV